MRIIRTTITQLTGLEINSTFTILGIAANGKLIENEVDKHEAKDGHQHNGNPIDYGPLDIDAFHYASHKAD